jgi:hypothetical protein
LTSDYFGSIVNFFLFFLAVFRVSEEARGQGAGSRGSKNRLRIRLNTYFLLYKYFSPAPCTPHPTIFPGVYCAVEPH